MNVKIAGRFKLTVRGPDMAVRWETHWMDNLVTDTGLERIGTGSWFSACHVGAGSTTPVVADTAMQTYVAGTTTIMTETIGAASASPYYGWKIRTFRFAAGVATGNLSEVGIATASANGGSTILVTRALIEDQYGDPTTITILSDEVLDVTYEFRLYPSTEADVSGSVVIGGVTYTLTIRPASITSASAWGDVIGTTASLNPDTGANVTFYNGAIGAITTGPSGSGSSSDFTNAAYGANSKYRDGTITLGLTQGNVAGGIRSFANQTSLGRYQVDFGASVPKDATKTLSLTVRLSWDRL